MVKNKKIHENIDMKVDFFLNVCKSARILWPPAREGIFRPEGGGRLTHRGSTFLSLFALLKSKNKKKNGNFYENGEK